MTDTPRIGLWRSLWSSEQGLPTIRLEIVEGNLYTAAMEDGAHGYAKHGGAAYDAYEEVDNEVYALRHKFAENMLAFGVEPRLQVAVAAVIEYMYEHTLTDWRNGLDDDKKPALPLKFRPTGAACPYSRILVDAVDEALADYDQAMTAKTGATPMSDKERFAYARTHTFAAVNWAKKVFDSSPAHGELFCGPVEPLDMHLGRAKGWNVKLLKALAPRKKPALVAA